MTDSTADSTVPTDNDPIVPNPTYMGYIRNCFTAEDVSHMAAKGIDIGTYAGVMKNSGNIYVQTLMPNANMPPAPRPKWSANRSLNFKTWILAKFPQGAATAQSGATALKSVAGDAVRLRKNVNSLDAQEVAALTAAFNGIMALDPSNPNSYMALAGIHGYPGTYCLHHVDGYNPWHRVYIDTFEDALRTIPGCEDVTMPYWDITEPSIPTLFSQAPFNSYTIETSIGDPNYPIPYTTQRYADAQILSSFQGYGINSLISTALTQALWGGVDTGGFNQPIMEAHDDGHQSIGTTMTDQGVAAFDPIFWFFHCNWERLFWSWQNIAGATTLTGFTNTLAGDTGWLTFPPLAPWTLTPDQTIPDSGIAYDQLASGAAPMLENRVGSIAAERAFTVQRSTPVSVRVKGINRLNIPGTFVVHLLADGELLRKRAFFQPSNPRKCANCKEHGLVNIDFRVGAEELHGRKLSVRIEVPAHAEMGEEFPLSQVGNPTINARLLLEDA